MSRAVPVLSLLLLCAGLAWGAPAQPKERPPVAVFLDDASPQTKRSVAAGIAALGGRVVHEFDDVLIVLLPSDAELRAYRVPGVREVALNGMAASPARRGQAPSFGRAAWSGIARFPIPADREEGVLEPLEGDGLTPPAVTLEAVLQASRAPAVLSLSRAVSSPVTASLSGAPFGATALNTSEFLAGAVSVNIVLVESDGSVDSSTENWSAAREGEVVAAIASGLEWVRLQEPQASLRFVYHVYPGRTDARARTGYEPIRRAADPTGLTGEDRWAKDVLGKLGYAIGDRFARSRALASDTRIADGTDWAVNVFVVDSLADTDGKFSDGRFAYCWIGGPHLVMTYDNHAWGIGRMDMVLRHELLHAFYAFDEYAGSGCDCSSHRGYLDGVNTNCVTCNPVALACVMISNGDALCAATRRHVGWADLDGDGAIDVVGQDPDTFFTGSPAKTCGTVELTGQVAVVAATNRNTYPGTPHPSISVNRIGGVEVRVDDGPWTPVGSDAGTWGNPQTAFRVAIPLLASGAYRLEARAVDDFGNRDSAPARVDVVAQGGVAALGNSVRLSKSGAGGLTLNWDASEEGTSYRIYRRSAPNAPEGIVAETPLLVWSDPATGTGFYQVRPVDACGGEAAD